MRQTHQTDSAAATVRLGRALAATLGPGDTVLLAGELGSGKTTLVRGIAEGLGVDPGLVASPTFVIVNEYRGRVDLVHVDAYRLRGGGDLDSLGWDRAGAGDAIVVVEWPERIEAALAPRGRVVRVSLRATGPRSREVVVEAPEEPA